MGTKKADPPEDSGDEEMVLCDATEKFRKLTEQTPRNYKLEAAFLSSRKKQPTKDDKT